MKQTVLYPLKNSTDSSAFRTKLYSTVSRNKHYCTNEALDPILGTLASK